MLRNSRLTSDARGAVVVRPAVSTDAEGIASIFRESADYHASLDPGRYWSPPMEAISARYREGQQHASGPDDGITLVAQVGDEIVGFCDVRLDQPLDPMHRLMIYCDVTEIAVSSRFQNRGIGGRLLQAAEDWGRQRGARFAALEYHAANLRAGEFYRRRMGYSIVSMTAIKRL